MTVNLCLGTKATTRGNVGGFFTDLAHRQDKASAAAKSPFRLVPQN